MSTYRDTDSCTDLILDFIAGGPGIPGNPSGESAGNYNAVIGDAEASDDLGLLDLDGIALLQGQLLADGQSSSAVGRYQIIDRTLNILTSELALPRDTKFTPETQDRLALQLLVGRGYKSWWRGEIGDITFAHNLSCEWASLPDPRNAGKSHYDGIGPNHAGTALHSVYTMLSKARSLKPSGPQH